MALFITSGPSIEAMSCRTPAILPQPSLVLASEAKIVSIQPAAEIPTGRVPFILNQDQSPFYHDHQSSWGSENIVNVLLSGIMVFAALLALGMKYFFIPRYAQWRQSGKFYVMTQGLDFR